MTTDFTTWENCLSVKSPCWPSNCNVTIICLETLVFIWPYAVISPYTLISRSRNLWLNKSHLLLHVVKSFPVNVRMKVIQSTIEKVIFPPSCLWVNQGDFALVFQFRRGQILTRIRPPASWINRKHAAQFLTLIQKTHWKYLRAFDVYDYMTLCVYFDPGIFLSSSVPHNNLSHYAYTIVFPFIFHKFL